MFGVSSDLTPDEISALYRQQFLIVFGLSQVLYGIYATLVFFLLYFFLSSEKKQRQSKVLMWLIVLMFIIQSIHDVATWYHTWLGFIKNGSTSDEALVVLQGLETTPVLVSLISMDNLLGTLRLAIADSIMVWRCWIIWNSWLITLIPFLTNIVSIAVAIAVFVIPLVNESPPPSYLPLTISSYSLSVATTVLATLLIAVRILGVSRMPGATRQPLSAIEIIVESAALYCISALVYIVMLSPTIESNIYYLYAEMFWAYMANFAPALIMLRVAAGRKWPVAKATGIGQLSGIHFHSSPRTEAAVSRSQGGLSTIVSTPQSYHNHEFDLEARTSN